MAIDERDLRQLRRALDLAEAAIGRSDPNPRVGCVLHDAQSRFAGEGATLRAGDAHAEVVALQQAAAGNADLAGGTAWVTLEPCSHHGRTPPCCDALITAKLSRVVVATSDPNPQVDGGGIQRMREAGITVDVADGLIARQARELNIGFFSRMVRGRPWVRMKLAASLDGRTALPDGQSQWITSEAARTDGHAWRRRAGALLTGAGTVLADNPRLDVRLVASERQPLRVVVDARLQCPPHSRIFAPPGEVLVYCAADTTKAPQAEAPSVERITLASVDGKVHLPGLLDDLARRGVNELHIEAGEKLNASFLREGLVDELLIYLAPTVLGAGLDMFAGPTLARLSDAPRLVFGEATPVGTDLRIRARFEGRDAFLA